MTAQEELVANPKLALPVPDSTETLLNLAEFMEHCEEAFVSGALRYCISSYSVGYYKASGPYAGVRYPI